MLQALLSFTVDTRLPSWAAWFIIKWPSSTCCLGGPHWQSSRKPGCAAHRLQDRYLHVPAHAMLQACVTWYLSQIICVCICHYCYWFLSELCSSFLFIVVLLFGAVLCMCYSRRVSYALAGFRASVKTWLGRRARRLSPFAILRSRARAGAGPWEGCPVRFGHSPFCRFTVAPGLFRFPLSASPL